MQFSGGAAGGRDARRATGSFLRRHDVSEECGDSVLLVVSELVTNAIRHAGGSFTLRVMLSAHCVEVAVSDSDPTPPRARVPDLLDGTGGFGSGIVARLAREVTICPCPEGKTLHVVIDRRTPPTADD
ncbi:ATP-binding protein [Streptomyces venezuelae]|uniref:ATP-binding protein n=2 Tax=Streptomyces TaxID=1883 RepID=A0A5P2B3V3_STRVZ|nr:ATP-binding protein [Streptomyces venezuelae]